MLTWTLHNVNKHPIPTAFATNLADIFRSPAHGPGANPTRLIAGEEYVDNGLRRGGKVDLIQHEVRHTSWNRVGNIIRILGPFRRFIFGYKGLQTTIQHDRLTKRADGEISQETCPAGQAGPG